MTGDSYTYMELSPDHISDMRQLLFVFAAAFEDDDTYQGAPPDDGYLAALLGNAHFIALTAHDGKIVVGGLTAYVLNKFEQERREIYIYDLAVAAKHRRRGVATGLINALQHIASDRGAYVIFVQADFGDDPAIKLYESLGTREDVLHFDIPVAKDQNS